MAPHTITVGVYPLCHSTMQAARLRSPRQCLTCMRPSLQDKLKRDSSENITNSQVHAVAVLQRSGRSCTVRYGHPDNMAVTLRGPVPARRCARPSSMHWFHTRITVVAACPVRAEMSQHDKPISQRPTVRTHSHADVTPFDVDKAYRHLISRFHFIGRLFIDDTLTFPVTQERVLLGLRVRHLSILAQCRTTLFQFILENRLEQYCSESRTVKSVEYITIVCTGTYVKTS